MNLKIRRIRKDSSSGISKTTQSHTVKKNVNKKENTKKTLVEVVPPKKHAIITPRKHQRQVTMNDVLIHFHEKYKGNWDKIYEAILNKEELVPERDLPVVDKYREEYEYITLLDNDYPDELRDYPRPPFVLSNKRKKYSDDEEM